MTTTSRENYLKHLFRLQQGRGGAVPMGELAQAMNVRPASVTGMVKAMVNAGLVGYEPYKGVKLTHAGQKVALDVIRRHRLIEAFLVKTLGVDWSEVHVEAEALEHAISDKLLDRIDRFLGRPTTDPHGDPIPAADGKVIHAREANLAQSPAKSRQRITRISDQDREFLQYVGRIGLKPGTEIVVKENDPQAQVVRVQIKGHPSVTLSTSAACKLGVKPC